MFLLCLKGIDGDRTWPERESEKSEMICRQWLHAIYAGYKYGSLQEKLFWFIIHN